MSISTRAIELVSPQVVGIRTPTDLGTGFVSYGRQRGARMVATAHHVIKSAINDGTPIHVSHGQHTITLGSTGLNRKLLLKTTPGVDSAMLVFIGSELPRPAVPILNPANAGGVGPHQGRNRSGMAWIPGPADRGWQTLLLLR